MQITAQEIAAVEEAGMLDQSPVKMIRTKGGFWIAVGIPRGKFREEALAAGSHPAIVKYNLKKQYPAFQELLIKSETFEVPQTVEKHSHFLSDDLRKSGHDIYSVQQGPDIVFYTTHQNVDIGQAVGVIREGSLVMTKIGFKIDFNRAMAGACIEKARANGAAKIKLDIK